MKIRHPLILVSYLFFFVTGFAHAANLVAEPDNYGIPADKFLQVEAPGVLSNDTLDGQNAGDNNAVTAVLVSSVTSGTLSCPSNPGVELCTDGSFEYTPDPGFSGTDSFTYQAAFGVDISTPATVTLSACNGGPTIFTCWHETSYRAKLSELGYNNLFIESFEGTPWDVVRSPDIGAPVTAPSITSKGITWETNHPGTNEITTGSGPARTGLWGGFDPDHGFATGSFAECDIDNPPIHCRLHDGLSGKIQPAGDKLLGVGGYISGFSNASIAIILDGTPHNVGTLPGAGHFFFGVIDAAGFNGFEFQEQGGKVGQEKFIFGDDFIIASSGLVDANNPPVLDPIGNQTVDENVYLEFTLTASDPNDGDSWSFSVIGAPVGSSLDDNFDGTATFSWFPDFTQAGSYPLTFTVTDNGVPVASASESITITVNDAVPPSGSLQFSTPSYSVNENGATATITVTRLNGSFGTVGVDYATSDGTATAGSDYTATSGTLSLADGVLSTTFTVAILDDIIYEGNESLSLALSNPTGGAGLGSPAIASLTITENDPVPSAGSLQFSAATYSVAENIASATITVTRVGGSFGTVGVDYASSDGTATAGSDYTATSGTLSLADGVLSATFSVAILDDTTYEGNESLNLALSNPTGGAGLGSPTTASLTITENDPVPPSGSLQFSTPSYSVNEDGVSATITVTRVGGSFGTVGVDYATSDGTATAGSDYTATSGALSLADGVLSTTFSVAILDDTTYEGNESLSLALSNPTGGAGLGSPTTASLTITENDPVPPSGSLQFSAATYSVAENGTTATITVTRTNGSFGTVGVDYASSDGTATAGSDYTATSGTLSLADGVLSTTFSVAILDDIIYEGNESLSLALSNPTGGAGLGSPATASLTITENDAVPPAGSLQFSTASYSVAENGTTATITVTRTNGSFGTVGIDYATSDGTATAGSDYTATSGSLSFADGILSQTFSVTILDDTTYEGNESLSLALSNPTGGAGLGSPTTASLTITENDPVPSAGSLQFSAATYSVAENIASATITVTRVGGSFGTVGVDYASSDGTATAGSDYTATSGTLSLADGVLSATFSVAILDDTTYEGNESLNLALSNPTGGAGLGSPTTASLTITENDPVPPSGSLQFSTPSYSVNENGATATITVTRVGGSFGTVGVDYASSDGTATAGSDYTATSGTLSLADGVLSTTFSVAILDDIIYEGNESLSLTLSNPTGGAGLGSPTLASLTITENDPVPPSGSLQFSAASYSVLENGLTASITVTRVGGSFGTVGVDYATSDVTATADSDYTATSGTLSLADGVLSTTFTVAILDDITYEGNESLSLALSNPTGGAGLGSPTTASLTITENDPVPPSGSLQFSAATYSVAENGTTATITVTRTNGSFGTVGVDYATSDGTATAGSDYTATSGSLSFADGILSQTFSVTILDDTNYEGNESLSLALSNPTGGAGLGSPATASLTITENDAVPPAGSLQFSTASYSVAENGTTATITVTRINGSFGTVGVDYASSDGTATAGSDYTATSGTLSLADGVLSATFTVAILDDINYEGNESLSLVLSNPTGGSGLGTPTTASLTITENDPVPPSGSLQFSAATYTVAENGVTASIIVTRVGGSFGTVGVDYASSDGTATAGSDYTATSGSLSFTDGIMSQTFNITILNDITYEGDETLSLALSNPTGGAGLGAPAIASLTITEDDSVPPAGSLQFSTATYSVAENIASATITVTRVGGSFGTVGVDYASSDGTATAGSDYTATSGSLSFTDGVLSQTFTVAILDDTTYEGNESLSLALSNPTGGAGLGLPATASLTITENDAVPSSGSLQFSAPSYSVLENGLTASITVTRVGGSFGTVGVDYASSDGTATVGSDYTATSGTLSLADGVLSATFSVAVLDDIIYEGNESLILTLSNPTGGAGLGSPTLASLTITEDDSIPSAGSMQFSAPAYTVTENGVSATITVTRINGSFGAASVDYTDIAGGSATPGSDYNVTNGTINFADGDTVAKTFTVPIIDDNTYEGDETVNLLLSNANGASLGAPSSAVLTITENELVPSSGSLQFSAASYSVAENVAIATITVTRVGGSFGTVGVDYASADISAMTGSDYMAASGSLSFADGVESQTFSVDIVDDADYEGDETLSLTLSNPTGGAGLGSPALAILTISEDDPVPASGSLQFSAVSYSVAENGTAATITVTRVGGSFGTVGVDYASADGSATAGSDYTAVSGALSFADGILSQSFTVAITDDAVFEGDETLNLGLSNPTGGAGLGSPVLAVLTISEDDPVSSSGSLQFSATSYTVAENGTTAIITVTRVGGKSGIVGVDYASVDGSAVAGSDYTAVRGSLIFASGVDNQTFNVAILDDTDYEGNEALSLTLSNPTGGAGLGSPALAILTISEDDPVPPSGSLQFSAASYSVAENGTTASITVTRVGGNFGTVGVDYASADGSATAGSDYTAMSSSLSFADGVVSQTFNVAILDDLIYEGDESLKLTLSNPTGGAGLSTPATASLVVIENEILSDISIDPVDTNASSGGGGGGSFDLLSLITLIVMISLYRRNLRIRSNGLYPVSR